MTVKRLGFLGLILILLFLSAQFLASSPSTQYTEKPLQKLSKEQLAPIEDIVEKAISKSQIPGAVVIVGTQENIVYRKAFGKRSLKPKKLLMTEDTIFDLSSLTKVIATATALMQLVEKGKLRLDDPVTKYWPEFKANDKENITVRSLLTHYSGLQPDLDLKTNWSGYKTALSKIIAEKPQFQPGTRFVYSDINFLVLSELVRRISGKTIDVYCEENIFKPLGMKDTVFNPPPSMRTRIAPTEYKPHSSMMLWGEVHDPTAQRTGGIAGHAGLFSTADDLSVFAQMMLGGGNFKGVKILSPLMVEKMTTPQTPPGKMVIRGLGWDIDSPFSSNRGVLFPVGSYGHTGYTGTSIWIDPVSKTYIIILTNRVHPYGRGDAVPLRSGISTLVASALGPVSSEQVLASRLSLTGYFELMKSYQIESFRNGKVQTGIDVLKDENFTPLAGLRVGLITNHSGIDSDGKRTIDLLHKAKRLKLVSIFTPEHGLSGKEDKISKVNSIRDPETGLPVYSLYAEVDRPTDKMLKGLDAIVFDIQDAGVRFYTYITTMGYALEIASKKRIKFFVLDRPNPITGSVVQGPVMDIDLKTFAGCFPLPVRHGMTVGELAKMFNAENNFRAELHVIKMRGYKRTDWYDETSLQWVNPSPNLRTLTEAVLYPGVAMAEGANVSVGRGTDTPFELLGAPWINAKKLSDYLNNRKIQGVRFMPIDFTPSSNLFKNEMCHGIQIILIDRQALDPTAMGIEIISALYKLFPEDFQIDKTIYLIGSHKVLQSIKESRNPESIVSEWQEQLELFRKLRSKYLLY
ncbi:MAG: hypothetical protein A2Y97_08090 [Nitrospirae bacterium RBG_13_39_12]|nr:MAG: hypothetical protein A2Y97_08090 [Nitrospirae bacterium RBG_13_39_12]